ncbi:MAG: hypothetical protein JWP37_2918 [Mucilaginibacter sp.]|nr:hypothetical protein [Mucilaginibacter sp.]
MKYAYILGSNAFVSPDGFISYTENGETKTFLSIRSIYHDTAADSRLSIDLDIKDMYGRDFKLTNNQTDNTTGVNMAERDRVLLTNNDGTTIIDIHQLDDESAMRLEHNIIAELEVHAPIAVIRIRGNFMLGGIHIEIDNEKLFVNDNSIANSTHASHTNLQFVPSDIVL